MNSTQERIKKRREYLKQKGKAYSKITGGSLVFATAAAVSLFCLFGACTVYLIDPRHRTLYPLNWLIGLAIASLVFGMLAWSGWKTAKQGKRALQIPYVPPVIADTLPAEEVLVRGSEQPAQEQGRVLLRGTDGSAGTGEQELLRGSQGQDTG